MPIRVKIELGGAKRVPQHARDSAEAFNQKKERSRVNDSAYACCTSQAGSRICRQPPLGFQNRIGSVSRLDIGDISRGASG